RLDEAIAEYREAFRLKKDYTGAYDNLGKALRAKGQLDEAIAEFREAIRINKDAAGFYSRIGVLLTQQGQFRQAVEAYRLHHEIGSRQPGWRPSLSAVWLRWAENLADVDARRPGVLQGQEQPQDAHERLALAQLCMARGQFFATARWS